MIAGLEVVLLQACHVIQGDECKHAYKNIIKARPLCFIFKTVIDVATIRCKGECLTSNVVRMRTGSACQEFPDDFIAETEAENSEDCLNKCQGYTACKNFIFFMTILFYQTFAFCMDHNVKIRLTAPIVNLEG